MAKLKDKLIQTGIVLSLMACAYIEWLVTSGTI